MTCRRAKSFSVFTHDEHQQSHAHWLTMSLRTPKSRERCLYTQTANNAPLSQRLGKVSETAKGDELATVSNWISPSNQSDFTIQPRSRQISPKKGRVGSYACSNSNGWVCPLIPWYPSLMWHMRIRDLTAVHCFAVLQYHADPHLQPVDVRQETLKPMQRQCISPVPHPCANLAAVVWGPGPSALLCGWKHLMPREACYTMPIPCSQSHLCILHNIRMIWFFNSCLLPQLISFSGEV